MRTGYLYGDDDTRFLKVREVEIVDEFRIEAGLVFRLRFLEPEPELPETVQVFARYPGYEGHLERGDEATVNATSDDPSLPIAEAFYLPTKTLVARVTFSRTFPILEPDFWSTIPLARRRIRRIQISLPKFE